MYHILVVEDEKIERETLISILKDHVKDCDEILSARNGLEAVELYKKYHPCLLCADINLPGMNGLDMIREMKKEQAETQYLILSSYNYFEYAQEAIRLGVTDFILKPYNIPSLVETVQRVVKEIRQAHLSDALQEKLNRITPMLERECLYAVVSNESEIEIYRHVHQIDKALCSGLCLVFHELDNTALVNVLLERMRKEGYRCIFEQVHDTGIMLMLYDQIITQEHVHILEEILLDDMFCTLSIGAGPVVNDVSHLHLSFELAREHIGCDGKELHDHLCALQSDTAKQILPIEDEAELLMNCFMMNDETALKKEINRLSEYLMIKQPEDIIRISDTLYVELLEKVKQKYPDLDTQNLHLMALHLSNSLYQDIPLNLNLNIKKIYRLIDEERFRNTSHLVKDALHYIDQNYQKQIVLADLADHLKVSPYHISRLLSASLHKTFTELIAQKRVEASKELLKSGERIKEIANIVGFQGQSYYNKIFKKYTGMTPKEYRNKIKS